MGLQCGSSPLARGTLRRCRQANALLRLIPARAGNTLPTARLSFWRSAHPRSRGEHVVESHAVITGAGSSPLARGTPLTDAQLAAQIRLIPARAGNTSSRVRGYALRSAHPRSRGEHAKWQKIQFAASGSSPLARGTRSARSCPASPTRLIPARAGNTNTDAAAILAVSAHPRSRGEHRFSASGGAHYFGSSPLARGTRGVASSEVGGARLIPARAGNTTR